MSKSSPSNNLKELIKPALYTLFVGFGKGGEDVDQVADTTINLILDTILASEEMQDEKINKRSTDEVQYLVRYENRIKAQIRAMLKGLKS